MAKDQKTKEATADEQLAALQEENAQLKELADEQAKQLAAHEKVNPKVTVSVKGRAAFVNGGLRQGDKVLTPQEIANDKALVEHLVKIGSDTIQFVD